MTQVTDSRSFRAAREADWRRLDELLVLVEAKSPRALSDEDLIALPLLYRSALSSLSVARETSLDLELVTWLESLCARAYFFLYGVRTSPWHRFQNFFAQDWPAAVQALWRETCASALLMLVGVLAGYLLVVGDPEWFNALVPQELANGRDFSASPELLRESLSGDGTMDALGVFATFLFTHNSQVAIFCFALGFAFGVPTALLLVHNGALMGAFIALFASRDLGGELGGWLIIHGSTEIFAIILAGAAGLRIGWAVVFPGEHSRIAAAANAGRVSGLAMAGVIVMLFIAGLLEGFARQLIEPTGARYGIGLVALLIWFAYFYSVRERRNG